MHAYSQCTTALAPAYVRGVAHCNKSTHLAKQQEEVVIGNAFGGHVLHAVRVDDLVAQAAQHKVRPLRHVEQATARWLRQRTAKQRPQACAQAEMGDRLRVETTTVHAISCWDRVPPNTRNKELLPHPFGPAMSTFWPRSTRKLRLSTRVSLLGVRSGTSLNSITSSLRTTVPCIWRTLVGPPVPLFPSVDTIVLHPTEHPQKHETATAHQTRVKQQPPGRVWGRDKTHRV